MFDQSDVAMKIRTTRSKAATLQSLAPAWALWDHLPPHFLSLAQCFYTKVRVQDFMVPCCLVLYILGMTPKALAESHVRLV